MASDHKGPNIEIPDDLAEQLGSAEELASVLSEADEGDPTLDAVIEPEPLEGGAEPAEGTAGDVVAELNDRILRMAAEHDNQKRRWLREQQTALNFANENLIKDLLPTVDNLERALDHARQASGEDKEKENLLEGIELTYRSLMGVLERAGIEVVTTDSEFDPRFHEAMRQIPSSEHSPNTIIEVYQRGYLLKGRLLRPALVAIAGPSAAE